MKKNIFFLIFLLAVVFLATSCQPKIYGQTRRKKDRKCGCELTKPTPVESIYTNNRTI